MENSQNTTDQAVPSPIKLKIIVNGQVKVWTNTTISFDEVVILAYGKKSDNPDISYRIEYKLPEKTKGGILEEGQTIEVKEGMVFNVSPTNRS